MSTAETSLIPAVEQIAGGEVMDVSSRETLEEHIYRYGRGYDSYLSVEPDRQYFWAKDQCGVISFVRLGRYVYVTGGLLAPEDRWEELATQFLSFAKKHKYLVTFFNLDQAQRELLAKLGLQITKVGEDAVIDLTACTWRGKPFEWVRRQSNYCQRHGLEFSECHHDMLAEEDWRQVMAELDEVSHDYLRMKPYGARMRNFVGRFEPLWLQRRRVFIARSKQGAGLIEGFIVCNPSHNGRRWSVEMMRHCADATRGVIPFLIHQTFCTFQDEGIPEASLCMIPALRCGNPLEGDSRLLRFFLGLSIDRFGLYYDIPGMYHFKTRFRPGFQECFVAASPKVTPLSMFAGMVLWGLSWANYFRVATRAWKRLCNRESRRSLVIPESGKPARSAAG